MVVGIVNGLAAQEHASTVLFVDAVLGVALGFGVWWIYFGFIGRRFARPTVWWALAWNYLHLALLMAIVMTGAGICTVIGHEGPLTPADRVLIASALGAALIVMALLEGTLRRAEDEPTHRIFSPLLKLGSGLSALGCGWLGLLDDPARLMLGLLGMLAVNVGYGVWVWFRQELDAGLEREEI
jgi:low temperature requirement protein LtrA